MTNLSPSLSGLHALINQWRARIVAFTVGAVSGEDDATWCDSASLRVKECVNELAAALAVYGAPQHEEHDDQVARVGGERDVPSARSTAKIATSDAPTPVQFLMRLAHENGAIVSSGCATVMEIANARARGDFLVIDGLGFILRFRRWRELAEAAIHGTAAD